MPLWPITGCSYAALCLLGSQELSKDVVFVACWLLKKKPQSDPFNFFFCRERDFF